MSFVSPEFALVALLFYSVYWALRPYREVQMGLLLISGYLLYASWSVQFAVILFLFSTYVWLAGWWLSGLKPSKQRGACFAVGVTACLTLLLATKYYSFSRDLLVGIFPSLSHSTLLPVLDFVAPAGISFFTFQAITYLVWEYREHAGRLRFTHLLLFLSFWPTLFAGPILRAKDFFAQLQGTQVGSPREPERAAYYLLLGLTQKLVFANWLALTFVDESYKYPDAQTATSVVALMIAYSLQIFFDFAGYTLIVTALALLLGFSLPTNFQQPYLSRNLGEFWRRWHMSLSFFIRDYVYIPLGGNRLGFLRTQINIFVAMLVSGLWHGANTTFIIWGCLHGVGVIVVNFFNRFVGRPLPTALAHTVTLLYVAVAWVFFRADSVDSAVAILGGFRAGFSELLPAHSALIFLASIYLFLAQYAEDIERKFIGIFQQLPPVALASITSAAVYCIILLGPSGVPGFIYYQF